METIQPVFIVRIISGQVFLDWNWGGNGDFLDIFQAQVNRGAGWVDLAYDTTPGYADTTPSPPSPPSGNSAASTASATTRSASGATK